MDNKREITGTMRFYVRVSEEQGKEIRAMAKKAGVPLTQFAGVCLYLGFGMYKRAQKSDEFTGIKIVKVGDLGEVIKVEKQKGKVTSS